MAEQEERVLAGDSSVDGQTSRDVQRPAADMFILGNARELVKGMPSARWQDGSFNPTRFKA